MWPVTSTVPDGPGRDARVLVEGLHKVFKRGRRGREGQTVAVAGVSFSIGAGEIFGLVGGSGAGKSTVARLMLRLLPATAGRVWVDGHDFLHLGRRELRGLRQRVQMVAQDPFDALHPGMRVRDVVAEPLVIHRLGSPEARNARVVRALEDVALAPASSFLDRYPQELSGGQRQRVAIARAIVLNPTLLIADEPTSMLDASVQLEVLKILIRLRDTRDFSALLITHDLAVARYVCNRIGVMRAGVLVEEGPVDRVIDNPSHEYTKALVAAAEG